MKFIFNCDIKETFDDFFAKYQKWNAAQLAPFFKGISTGDINANLTMFEGDLSSNKLNFSSFVEDDYVTINGVVFTGKNTPSGDNQFGIGASDEETRNNLLSVLLISELPKIYGVISPMSLCTIQLTSVVAGNSLVVNGVTFTASASPSSSTEFFVSPTDNDTAKNLHKVLSSYFPEATISVSTNTITAITVSELIVSGSVTFTINDKSLFLNCSIPGTIGNLCTLEISAHGSVDSANFTGGKTNNSGIYSASL